VPIYEYECAHCGSFEHSQSIHDRPLARCPKCRRKVQRLISASSFRLKGSGWYSDGYQKKAGGNSGESESKPESKSEAKGTESAPASGTSSKKKAKAESTTKKASSGSSSTSSD
jgi:putative FmdB family regulatory protein